MEKQKETLVSLAQKLRDKTDQALDVLAQATKHLTSGLISIAQSIEAAKTLRANDENEHREKP